jgi:hypothetical protein
MKLLLMRLWIVLVAWAPSLAFAEEIHEGYRGIATIYYTVMWVILCYGLYDAFGKKAFYVGAPLVGVILYALLPSE